MKINLAIWDRTLRYILSILLLSYAVAGGPSWSWSGIYFLFTASWGICPIYAFFRFKTLT